MLGPLHGETVADQPGELKLELGVAAGAAALVQLEPMALGAALECVRLVAALELLLFASSAGVVPSLRCVHTYRSPSKQYLRRLPAPDARQELVHHVLRHVHLHGLHVAVCGPNEGNASCGQQSRGHDERIEV